MEIAKLLIDKGADVNAPMHPTQATVLFAAVWHGNRRTVELLIDKGADLNAADAFGHTPLALARGLARRTGRDEYKAVADLLAARGAREDAPAEPATKPAEPASDGKR